MRFIFNRIFLGIILVLFGIGLFIERVYAIDLPLWGIFWSLVIIAIGISLIIPKKRGDWWGLRDSKKTGEVIFDEASIEAESGLKNYNIIFGKGDIDLTKLPKPTKEKIKINTVFGQGIVRIRKGDPIKIKATSTFGEARLPNGNSVSFADAYYESPGLDPDKPFIFIHVNVVFGSVEVSEV